MMSDTDQTQNDSTLSSNSSLNSLQPKSMIQTIKITKSKTSDGFGFNIVGGTDGPYIPGHDGIFICHIRKAELKGKINAGDRIVSVNGTSLETITHDKAVELFKELEGECEFKIEANAERAFVMSFDITPDGSTIESMLAGPSHASTLKASLHPMSTENHLLRYPSQLTEIVIIVVGAAALSLIAYLGYNRIKKGTWWK